MFTLTRGVLRVPQILLLNDSVVGALVCAETAINAEFHVDDVNGIAFADCFLWANVFTRPAGYTFIRDLVRHKSTPPVLMWIFGEIPWISTFIVFEFVRMSSLHVTAQLRFVVALHAHERGKAGVLRAAEPLSTPPFLPFSGRGRYSGG